MQTNWSEIKRCSDVNIATKLLIEKIQECIEKAKTKKKTRFKKRKAWIIEEIIKLCEKKDSLYRIWKEDLQNKEKKNNFTTFSNNLKKTIEQAKNKFENESVLSVSNNGKKLWQLINSKVNKKQKKFVKINKIVVDNKKVTKDLEMANSFNEYFSKIGNDILAACELL